MTFGDHKATEHLQVNTWAWPTFKPAENCLCGVMPSGEGFGKSESESGLPTSPEANLGNMQMQNSLLRKLRLVQGLAGQLSACLPFSLFIFICGIRRVGEKRRGGLVTTASSSFLVTYICGQFSTLYSIKGKRGTVLATG